jgi:hypothetical protein
MDDDLQSVIASLERKLEAYKAQSRSLEMKIERVRNALQQLKAIADSEVISTSKPVAESSLRGVGPEIAQIVEGLESVNEDDYPVEILKSLTRLGVARLVAQRNNGYITPKAFKKILIRSGVLRGTSQIDSISSRVLAESDDFEKVWPGLYRLTQATEKEVSPEEKTS